MVLTMGSTLLDNGVHFNLTGVSQKVYVNAACASHYLGWENQHMVLFRASVEWLQNGTFAGESNGSFAVSKDGQVLREK